MSKLILFLIVVCLIALVLYLSYKMDTEEVSKKRKDKIIKNNKKRDIDQEIYEDIYDMVKSSFLNDEDKNDESHFSQETMQIDTNQIKETIEKENSKFDTDLEEKILNDYIEILENEENNSNEEIEQHTDKEKEKIEQDNLVEEVEENNFVEETKKESEEEIYYNNTDENLNEFTMIFNSKLLKSTDEILEDDEDIALDDLQKEIAVANIKKYTRNKSGSSKLVSKKTNSKTNKKSNSNVKRYTRKKTKKEPKEDVKKVKRYTRKKIINTNKENSEVLNTEKDLPNEISVSIQKDNKPKLKRGRPRKIDKPKRGRPKKEEKPKRGRPKKEDKPKRGRPKKTDTVNKNKK